MDAPQSSPGDPIEGSDPQEELGPRMHYPDSKDRSAELLRQAIPIMAQQPAPLHPITYAVWYDYLAGRAMLQAVRDASGREAAKAAHQRVAAPKPPDRETMRD